MTLAEEIRSLYSNGGPIDREYLIPILLALLDRIEALEDDAKEST